MYQPIKNTVHKFWPNIQYWLGHSTIENNHLAHFSNLITKTILLQLYHFLNVWTANAITLYI